MHDLHATILHLLGLDHEKLTYPLRRPQLPPDRRGGARGEGHSVTRSSSTGEEACCQSVTLAKGKRLLHRCHLCLSVFSALGLFGYYYVQGKRNADKPKVETVERTIIIPDNRGYDEFIKQARKQDSAGEIIYSRPFDTFTIHARNRGSAGKVELHYHLDNAKSSLGIRDWGQFCYFEAGAEKTVQFGLPGGLGTGGKSIYTVTVEQDLVIISGVVFYGRELFWEVFVASCLVLSLFLGILGMLFFVHLVRKAPDVNERISVSKKLIVSVLSSLWVGAILWVPGWYASAVIVRKILDHVNANFLWDNFFQVNSLIAAALSLLAMIGFGYMVYRRLSAAYPLVAGKVGRKCSDAVRKTADDLSVQPGEGFSNKP